jgi:hypothetical protein
MDPLPVSQRLRRLQEIAEEEEVGVAKEFRVLSQEDSTLLSPPRQIPSFRTPDDERKADAVLGQLRIELAQAQPQAKGRKRAFTANRRQSSYDYEELHVALTRVIDDNGLAGVAEVLLNRCHAVGGDINLARRASTSVIKKFTNAQSPEQRGRLLQTAAEQCRSDFVQLLSPYADAASLDESLSIALNKNHLQIVEILLRYGIQLYIWNVDQNSTNRSPTRSKCCTLP